MGRSAFVMNKSPIKPKTVTVTGISAQHRRAETREYSIRMMGKSSRNNRRSLGGDSGGQTVPSGPASARSVSAGAL